MMTCSVVYCLFLIVKNKTDISDTLKRKNICLLSEVNILLVFPEIDKSKTRKRVRKLLKQYRRLQRTIGTTHDNLRASVVDDMPKDKKLPSHSRLIKKIDAEKEIESIDEAIKRVSSISQKILYYSYCHYEYKTNVWIANKLGYYLSSIENKKSIALIEFAEAYKGGELLVLID